MLNEVLNDINSNMTWRLNELREFKNIANKLNDYQAKILLKSLIPMVYAHWEGFIVSTMKIVFQYLNQLNLRSDDYCYIYLTTAYENSLSNLEKSTNFDKRKKHLKNLYDNFSKQVQFNDKIDTKSNLKFDVLTEICKKINLDESNFLGYKEDLNMLVHIRNGIAHGDTESIVFENYEAVEKYIDLLENLMIDFVNQIQILLEKEKFKKEDNNDESI